MNPQDPNQQAQQQQQQSQQQPQQGQMQSMNPMAMMGMFPGGRNAIYSLLGQGVTPSVLSQYMSAMGGGMGNGSSMYSRLPIDNVNSQNNLLSAYNSLGGLNQSFQNNANQVGFTPLNIIGHLAESLGLNPGRTGLNSQISASGVSLGNALGKNAGDVQSMLPNSNDSAEAAQQKIAALQSTLKNQYQGNAQGYANNFYY